MKSLAAPRVVSKRGNSWATTIPREALGPLVQAERIRAEWKYNFELEVWTVQFRAVKLETVA